MNQLDHLVIAAPDLAHAKTVFAKTTGCTPADGGAHNGWGTRNALVSFGTDSYLEVIAPDPEQPLEGNLGSVLAKLSKTVPLHWAVRVTDLALAGQHARDLGFVPGPIRTMSRTQPDGKRLDWELMGITGHGLGGFIPFYIDWLQSTHPSTTNPVVGELLSFEIRAPDGPIHALLENTHGVTVTNGSLRCRSTIASEVGEVVFQANELLGFNL
ncbi:MAG TPA: VOC family protein [Pirellulaceae bacterium]|jgi:hypothetical protein|nr:VOC family protein [Pirellulaceae bacterium]